MGGLRVYDSRQQRASGIRNLEQTRYEGEDVLVCTSISEDSAVMGGRNDIRIVRGRSLRGDWGLLAGCGTSVKSD